MQAMSPQMLAMLAQKSGQMQGGISSLVSKKAPVDSNGLPMVFSETYGWMPDSGDGTVPGMMPQGGDFVPQTGTPGYTDGDRLNQPPQQTVQPPSQSPTEDLLLTPLRLLTRKTKLTQLKGQLALGCRVIHQGPT